MECARMRRRGEKWGPSANWRWVVGGTGVLFLLLVAGTGTTQATREQDRQGRLPAWQISLEEPTGIDRRDREVVTVKASFGVGEAKAERLRIRTPQGEILQPQLVVPRLHPDGSLREVELLFPVTILPGERPDYILFQSTSPDHRGLTGQAPQLELRRIGVGRLELIHDQYGIIVNLGREKTQPALVGAYHKGAADLRMLNLIDTSPDVEEPLAYGVRSAGFGTWAATPKAADDATPLPPGGFFDKVELLEEGPYRLRVRLRGARHGDQIETWELTATAGSPILHWRSWLEGKTEGLRYGHFFSSVSATPYEPFDKWLDGEETRFPDGWEIDDPPDEPIAPRFWGDLPGGHLVYYQRRENYGALGFLELDQALEWHGIGARQFYTTRELTKQEAGTEIGISFPRWDGTLTIVEARREYRKYRHPILSVMRRLEREAALDLEQMAGKGNHTARGPKVETLPIPRLPLPGTAADGAPSAIETLDLSGPWKVQWAEKSEGEKQRFHEDTFDDQAWRVVSVPGSPHTQILPSPAHHTREAEWISTKEWWYRRTLTVSPLQEGRRRWLRFEATDYYADIYLNGKLLGRHEGYIDPYEFEVTDLLRAEAPNQLAVRVWTPVSYYWRHRPYTIKGSYGAVDQKPDKITALGITRPVRLETSGPVRIEEIAIDTRLPAAGRATVVVDLTLEATQALTADLRLTLRPDNFEGLEGILLTDAVQLKAGRTVRQYRLEVANPALWWTWDHGKPNLYRLHADLQVLGTISHARTLRVGIREIEQIDWKFYLNGRRLFIRGTNLYYNLFLSDVRRADYERDLGLMRQMNINMVRLHCHFSNPELYELSDELGLLLFQDYLEAWYPEDRAFSLQAARLYDPLIRYVRNHPSIALWATSDEESLENYRDLTKHLEPRPFLHDPQRRPVVRSTGRYGDAHVYEGWYGGTIWAYTQVTEKFISELGATALPNYESLIRFLPNHWPIEEHTEEWVFHKLQIKEAMRAWGRPEGKTIAEYIPQTQDYVARLFQLAIERMRRLKYAPAGGILHFHAVDLWPSVTMAALDYYRQPTKSYTTVQRSFQMVLPSFAYDRAQWKAGESIRTDLWLINDRWEEIPQAKVSWRVLRVDGSEVQRRDDYPAVTIGADSSQKWQEVSFRLSEPGRYALWATIRDRNGKMISENNYEFEIER
jgi:beta-mannosidase